MAWIWVFVPWVLRTVIEAGVPALGIGLAACLLWRRVGCLRAALATTSVLVAVGWVAACAVLARWPPGPPVRVLSSVLLRQDVLWGINPLGLAAFALAPFAVRSAWRTAAARASATSDQSPAWVSPLAIGFLALTATAYVLYVWPPLPYPWWYEERTAFDADRWEVLGESDGYGRAYMLRSLFRDEDITHKTRKALVARLGPPQAHCPPDHLLVPVDIDVGGTPASQAVTAIAYAVGYGWDSELCYLILYFGPDGQQMWAYKWIAT